MTFPLPQNFARPALLISLAALLLLGAFLYLHALGRQSLWQDEINTVTYVQDLPSLAETVKRVATWDFHSPLYYVLLLLEVKTYRRLGILASEASLRLLSALLGTLALPMIFLLARRVLRSDWLALFALFLAVFNIYGVYYSQELRMYSLILLLGTCTLFCQQILWNEDTGRLNRWAALGYVLSCAGLLYSSLVSLFFVAGIAMAGQLLSFREMKTRPGRWRQLLLLHALIVIAYLPWLPALWWKSRELKGGVWTGLVITHPREFFKFAFENLYFHSFKIGPGWGLVNRLIRLLLLFSLANLWDKPVRRPMALLFLGFVLTFALQFGLTWGRPFHTGRYLAAWWPFALVLLAASIRGVGVLARRLAGWGVWLAPTVALLLAGFYSLVQWNQLAYYFNGFEKENWRAAAAYLEQNRQPGDYVLALNGWDKNCWAYYGKDLKFVLAHDLAAQGPPADAQRLFFASSQAPENIQTELDGIIKGFVPLEWEIKSLYGYKLNQSISGP